MFLLFSMQHKSDCTPLDKNNVICFPFIGNVHMRLSRLAAFLVIYFFLGKQVKAGSLLLVYLRYYTHIVYNFSVVVFFCFHFDEYRVTG